MYCNKLLLNHVLQTPMILKKFAAFLKRFQNLKYEHPMWKSHCVQRMYGRTIDQCQYFVQVEYVQIFKFKYCVQGKYGRITDKL